MLEKLPPRERQILDFLYSSGSATVAQVCAGLPDQISESAVRTILSRLEGKGFAKRRSADNGYVFAPAVSHQEVRSSVLRQLVRTFFNGSPAGAASALIGFSEKLSSGELDELERAIQKARKDQAR